MRNQDQERFFNTIKKVDGINIVLQYKPGRVFYGEHFYMRKKCYSINLCIVCNFQKRLIYFLTGFLKTTHNSQVWATTQIHQYPI